MATSDLIMTLGKVIIAAAWADGKITHDEIISLKDLMFHLPNLTRLQWAELDMYIETPVVEGERERLVDTLRQQVNSGQDRQFALDTLQAMISADGEITESEQAMMDDVREQLDGGMNVFGGFRRLVGGSIDERTERLKSAPNRDEFYDDFIKNKVYYEVQRRLQSGEVDLDMPDDQLRKLSFAGGLMAQIARVQAGINEDELQAIADALETHWQMPRPHAAFVAQVAASELAENLDYMRTAREFYGLCTEAELSNFLDALFQVAASDGMATYAELEEVRAISRTLHFSNEQFIAAKIKIPKDKRET